MAKVMLMVTISTIHNRLFFTALHTTHWVGSNIFRKLLSPVKTAVPPIRQSVKAYPNVMMEGRPTTKV